MKRLNHSLIAWFCFVLALFCASGVAALLVQRQERLRGALNGLPSADSPLRVLSNKGSNLSIREAYLTIRLKHSSSYG